MILVFRFILQPNVMQIAGFLEFLAASRYVRTLRKAPFKRLSTAERGGKSNVARTRLLLRISDMSDFEIAL